MPVTFVAIAKPPATRPAQPQSSMCLFLSHIAAPAASAQTGSKFGSDKIEFVVS
jgi:hypothetical protein